MGPVANSATAFLGQKSDAEGVKGVAAAGGEKPDTSSGDSTDGDNFLAMVAALFPQAAPPQVVAANSPASGGTPTSPTGGIASWTAAGVAAGGAAGISSVVSWNSQAGNLPWNGGNASNADAGAGAAKSGNANSLAAAAKPQGDIVAAVPQVGTAATAVAVIAKASSPVLDAAKGVVADASAAPQSRFPVDNGPPVTHGNPAIEAADSGRQLMRTAIVETQGDLGDLAAPLLETAATELPDAEPLADDDDLEIDNSGGEGVSELAGEAAQVESSGDSKASAKPADAVTLSSLPDRLAERIADQMGTLRDTGRAEVQMSLHPPELGNIQVHLKIDDGNMHIQMTVQSDNVKRILDQQLEPLRVRFSEMGVGIGQFDVRHGGGQTPSGASKEEADDIVISAANRRRTTLSAASAYAASRAPSSMVDVLA